MKLLLLAWIFSIPLQAEVTPDILAANVMLLGSSGNEEAPSAPDVAGSPFGMLLALRGSDQMKQCSAVHLSPGKLLTAAHCVERDGGWRYIAIFFASDGRKSAVEMSRVLYLGGPAYDVAVLGFAESEAVRWAVAGPKIEDLGPYRKDSAGRSDINVILWSFTPIDAVPELKAKYPGRTGMVFRPNQCRASRERPGIEIVDGERSIASVGILPQFSSETHLFLDECRHRIVPGNSGSLITHNLNFRIKLGVLSFTSIDKRGVIESLARQYPDRPSIEFNYRGLDNLTRRMSTVVGDFSLGGAALLQSLAKERADLIPQ